MKNKKVVLISIVLLAVLVFLSSIINTKFNTPNINLNIELVLEENILNSWNDKIMSPIVSEPIFEEGFIYKIDDKCWNIDIKNNGDDIDNIEIKYKIIVFKNEIEFGMDKLDIKSHNPIVYKEYVGILKYSDLKSLENFEQTILYMGTFPKIEITILSIIINGSDYEELPDKVSYTFHEFSEVEDMQHLRKLLGLIKSEN